MSKEKPKSAQQPLKYLRPDIEKPFPEKIEKLIVFLDDEKERLKIAADTLRGKKEIFEARIKDARDTEQTAEAQPKLAATQEALNKNELRSADISGFRKLLFQHAENYQVQEVSEALNKVYGLLFDKSPPSEFTEAQVDAKARMLLESATPGAVETVHQEYITRNERLDDTLDAVQTAYIVELGRTNNPNALFEAYVTSIDRYRELTDKILLLPKPERDKNIDVLLKNVVLYESLVNGEYEKRVDAEMDSAVREILDKQESQFKGLRGMIQRGIEAGSDFAIDHLSGFLGDEDSFARNIFITAAKIGKDLSKPVNYDPALIERLKDETKIQLKQIAEAVDPKRITAMREACVELKANPDHLLAERNREKFMEIFNEYLPVTTALIERTIATQTQLIHDAYVLSHGKDSQFETDWTLLRAKFFAYQGKDAWRLLQIYSPFGVFLPGQVELKDGSKVYKVYLESAYNRGWFKEQKLASLALQAVEGVGLIRLTYGAFSITTRLLLPLFSSFIRKPVKKLIPIVGQVLIGYEAGAALEQYRVSEQEREIFEMVSKYNTFDEIPTDEREEIRQLILENEIRKRRKPFQSIGYDLKKMDISLVKRAKMGNLENLEFRDTMKQTGTFRESILAANRKLVLLGFEPYEIAE